MFGFETRNPAHGGDSFVILDPTSVLMKNVAVSCFKTKEIMNLFKTIFTALDVIREELKMKVLEKLPENMCFELLSKSGFNMSNGKPGLVHSALNLLDFNNMDHTVDEK